MKEEAKDWLDQSEEDLGTAEDCLRIKRFQAAAFYSHQAAEKVLKALQVEKLGRFDKSHNLGMLADSVKAPAGVVKWCIKLNPYYVVTRYPDVGERIDEGVVEELPNISRRVVEWARQALRQ